MRENLKEKYVATLIGCGIGDTLGMPVEAMTKEQIIYYTGGIKEPIDPVLIKNKKGELMKQDKFGKLAHYTRDLKKGEYTDDTICTLAIAESIANKGCLNLDDLVMSQIRAYQNCKQENGHVRGGWGGSTKRAFEKIIKGATILKAGTKPGLGNGTCMKISPIGLYMDSANKGYYPGLKIARQIGQSTHKDERSIAAGVVQADAIYALLQDNLTRDDFLDYLICSAETWEKPFNQEFLPEKGTLKSRLKWVKENSDADEETAFKFLGNSCLAIDSYPFTIFMFQKYFNKPIEGLLKTVNWGGDCDTTGAIFGALAGAKNGLIFPKSWVKTLKNHDKLKKAAQTIYELNKIK